MTEEFVLHPKHYNEHPSGVECIDIVEHMNFCLGNAMKYIWRADLKWDAIQDLEKAVFYINQEIDRRKRGETRSKEEGLRETNAREHQESVEFTDPAGWKETDYKERGLSASEYFLQHGETVEDY